jgi:hypothetical protein
VVRLALPAQASAAAFRERAQTSGRTIAESIASSRTVPNGRDLILRPIPGSGTSGLSTFIRVARKYNHDSPNVLGSFHEVDQSLSDRPDTDNVPVFMHNLLLRKYAEDAARKIQWFCRGVIDKKHWHGLIKHLLTARQEILIRVFLGWRLGVTMNFEVAYRDHDRLLQLFQEKPVIMCRGQPLPFHIYWLTGCLFVPKRVKLRAFYRTARLLRGTAFGRRLLRLWHSIAHSGRCLRQASIGFRFTIQKRQCFGYIFVFFSLWYRYTRWKHATKQGKTSYQLPCSEVIIDWRIREHRLNLQKSRYGRACRFSVTRVMKKAHSALYQLHIDAREKLSDFHASGQFYVRHVHERAHRAWMRYMAIIRENRAQLRKLVRAWYESCYQFTRRKKYIGIMTAKRRATLLSKAIHGWSWYAKHCHLRNVQKASQIQKQPLWIYCAVFHLRGMHEFAFFGHVFRAWCAFCQRRKLWRAFARYTGEIDPDREYKAKILYALVRAMQQKLVRRFSHPSNRSLPHQTDYSFDAMSKWISESRQLFHSRTQRFWAFQTELRTGPVEFSGSLLARSLICAIHQRWPYERVIFPDPKSKEFVNSGDWTPRTLAELEAAVQSNCAQLRAQLVRKLLRDSAVLCVVDSHFSALDYHAYHAMFSVAANETLISTVPVIEGSVLKLVLYDDVAESVEVLSRQNEQFPAARQRIDKAFRHAIAAFHRTYRAPADLFPTQAHSATTSPRLPIIPTEGIVAAPRKAPISVYRTPIVRLPVFPIEDPQLREIKALKKRHEKRRESSYTTPVSRYGLDRFEACLQGWSCNDMLQSVRRFFMAMIGTRIDISDRVDFGQNTYDDIPPEKHHVLRRRINAFLGQLSRVSLSEGVPLKSDAPQWGPECVSAILTVFRALKKLKKTQPYCDRIPFPDEVALDDLDTCSLRASFFTAAYEKFPKLNADGRRTPQGGRRKHSSAKDPEDISYDDIMAAAFVIPLVIRSEFIRDFLTTEVEMRRRLTGATEDDFADDGDDSGEGDD